MAPPSRRPIILDAAQKVYDAMLKDADAENYWEGKTSELVEQVIGNRNRYAEIMDVLKQSGAVEVIRRGAGMWPSILKVNKDVTLKPRRSDKPSAADITAIEQRLASLEKLIGGLDVSKALFDLGAEIEALKKKVAK